MLTYLAEWEDYFGPLRLFRYLTFRGAGAVVTALVVGFVVAPRLLERLSRFKMAQTLRTESEVGRLATLHEQKRGTPTMGGLIIVVSVVVSAVLWAEPTVYVVTALLVFVGLAAVGFVDDYLKVTRKSSGGLASRWKLAAQGGITLLVAGILLGHPDTHLEMRQLWAPFFKEPVIGEMPIVLMAGFLFLVLAGSSNAINLTDGVDGLAIGCTVTVALTFAVLSYAAGNVIVSEYLLISHVPGAGELAVVCAALIGGSLAFLWFNAHPAEVFMGDTGSLALGGLIGAVAFLVHQPFTLVIIGGIFVMEALSVIIQVVSYKTRRKRVFRMAPLHHHFELGGWAETQVVIRFWILSLIFALLGLATLKLR